MPKAFCHGIGIQCEQEYPPLPPIMESPSQRLKEWGSRLVAETANIAGCPLKRIDPSLRPQNVNQGEAENSDYEVTFVDDQFGEVEPPDTEMRIDVGGDVHHSS